MKFFRILLLLLTNILSNQFISAQTAASCLNFDGVNDYVNISNNSGVFNVSASHYKTAQVWYKSLNTGGNAVRIFSTGSANWTSGFWLGFAPGSNFLMLEMSDGVGTGQVINATVTSRGDNIWHHATAVMNGTLASLYQDGILQGTVNISGEGAMPSSGAVHVGNSYNNESASYFTGNIDELRIWDRALCGTEILNTKDCELSGNEFGLVAYYQFNQGVFNTNNSAVASLNGSVTVINTGTLTNFGLSGLISNWTQPSAIITGNTCSLTSAFSISVAASAICYNQYAILTSSGAITYTWFPGPLIGNSHTIIPTASMVYTIYGIDSGGCLGMGNYSLNVFNNTTLSVTPSGTLICPGQNVTLTASGSSSGNYYWTPGGQFTSQIVVSPTVLSVYTVSSQIGGCSAYGTVAINISTISVILSGNTVICVGKSTTITASGANTYTWLPSTIGNNVAVLNPSISTIYTVNGTNSQGCTANQTINIKVNPNPTLNITSNNIDICKGNSTMLNASGANNYSWSPVVSTSNTVLINPTQTTTYNVMGTNSTNCSSIASIVINVNTCIGLDAYKGFEDLKVFPNPIINILKIEGLPNLNFTKIEIISLNGEMLYSKTNQVQETTLDLSLLATGFYVLRISNESQSFKKYIMKE